MRSSDFKKLDVWNLAMDFALEIYGILPLLPNEERFGLCDQMRRAAISVPSNIAEGQSRISSKEFIHFLSISKGSLAELETQLILCQRLGYIDETKIIALLSKISSIGRMTKALMNTLQTRQQPQT